MNGTLCLPIRLWMKCCTKVNLSTKTFLKRLSEMRGKLRTSIRCDRQMNPIQPHNLIDVKLDIVLPEFVVLTAKKREDLVFLSTITQIESRYLRVRGNPVMKSILITSHYQVGMLIS